MRESYPLSLHDLLACLLNEQKVESGLEERCLDPAALASLWPHSLIYKLGGGGEGGGGRLSSSLPGLCPSPQRLPWKCSHWPLNLEEFKGGR